jgi:hypothetical protein
MIRAAARRLVAGAVVMCAVRGASSQSLPTGPIVFADERVAVGANISATAAPEDPGYFNYTDYEHSALRMLQIDFTASVRLNDHLSARADVRTENGEVPTPYGLYFRIRPWLTRNFDIQVGRVPPTFGSFPRRTYASDNLLIGYPLGYQYLTSLRDDALPASNAELLRMRGRGWLSSYSIGNPTPDTGLPLADGFRWDTGVQVHGGNDTIDATGSITTGSLSHPLFGDNNDGKQFAGRVAYHPFAGLLVGASASHAPFVDRAALTSLPGVDQTSLTQRALGFDAEYSRDYYLVRFETIVSDWKLPPTPTLHLPDPLRAVGTYVEGRYKIRPGLYAAARVDHLGFGRIASGVAGAGPVEWEAPVTRVEVGGGYSIQRNLIAKVSYQHNTRPAGRAQTVNLVAVQLIFWF